MLSKEIHSGRFCECKIQLQSNSLRGLIFVHIITPNKPKLASLVVGSGLALFSCCSIRRRYEVWLLSLFLFSFLFLNYSPVDLKGHHKQAAFHKSHTQNRAERKEKTWQAIIYTKMHVYEKIDSSTYNRVPPKTLSFLWNMGGKSLFIYIGLENCI